MPDPDTTMGRGPASFPSTRWSLVRSARDAASPECRSSLEALAAAYWRPVYAYIRRAWSRSNEDAKDLAQEFLARLADGSLLSKVDADKGRFRSYLKGALKHFLLDAEKTAGRIKRGGGARPLSLDVDPALDAADDGAAPETAFDRAWAASLMHEAVEELKTRLEKENRAVVFEVFRRYHFPASGSAEPSYGEVGAAMDLPASTVKAHLSLARLLLRKIIRERVSDTVANEEELYRELKELFAE